jgi:hypothetical protein
MVKNNNRSAVENVVCDDFPGEIVIRSRPGHFSQFSPSTGILVVGQGLEPLLHGAGFGLARIQEWIRSSESEVSGERLDPM